MSRYCKSEKWVISAFLRRHEWLINQLIGMVCVKLTKKKTPKIKVNDKSNAYQGFCFLEIFNTSSSFRHTSNKDCLSGEFGDQDPFESFRLFRASRHRSRLVASQSWYKTACFGVKMPVWNSSLRIAVE